MAEFRCPVCRQRLSKRAYEKALGILGEREAHLRHEKAALQTQVRRAEAQAKKARAEGVQFERNRTQRLLAGKDEHIRGLEEQLRRLKKGTTPQTDGLEFEAKLYKRLGEEFPSDRIEHDGRGGDILHWVLVRRQPVGLILYECKRCRRIEAGHVEQAARDKRLRQADFAILVTTGKRRGFTGLAHEGPVLLVSPLGVVALAGLVRSQLLEMARARLSKSERERVATRALDFLTGPLFRGPLEDAISRTEQARRQLQREMQVHMQQWRDRWNLYQTTDVELTLLRQNAERVLQGEKPVPLGNFKTTPLALPRPA